MKKTTVGLMHSSATGINLKSGAEQRSVPSGSFYVAQLGARMHYAVPRILHSVGRLARLYTDICAIKGWPHYLRALPSNLRPAGMQRLLGRVPHGIPADRVNAFTAFGFRYAMHRLMPRTPSTKTSTNLWAGRAFGEHVIQDGIEDAAGVYTFNSAGLEVLRHANKHGMRAVMEQTIAPRRTVRKLTAEEHEAFPEWQSAPAENQFMGDFFAREQAEWEAADTILCGSTFVRDKIAECGGPVEQCIVVPYGVDVNVQSKHREKPHTPLRVLTIGAVGLRKGAPYELEAARLIGENAHVRMVGGIGVSAAARESLSAHVELTGPVPRSEISEHYTWADVFLLPSICEGSATVCYEALAAGLPVITTPNAGSIVRDGVDGFIVPIRNAEAIAEKLELLWKQPDTFNRMSRSALKRASKGNLEAYAARLLAAIG